MTFSKLIAGTLPHHNKYSNRNGKTVQRTLDHHWAGTKGGDARLTDPKQKCSANYIIKDGKIYGQVHEEFRAWTSGSFEADAESITLEIQNESGQVNGNDNDPKSWKISDANLKAALALKVDIAQRHGWGIPVDTRTRYHREFAQTSCPGGIMWNYRHTYRNRFREEYKNATGSNVATPITPAKPTPTIASKTVWQLADEVMAGVYGSGEARKKALGNRYAEVQAEVNRRFGLSAPGVEIPAATKTTAQLVDEVIAGLHGNGEDRKKSLGARYAEVQKDVNARVGGVLPKKKSISQLADEVMRGVHGNGRKRKLSLGSNYAAVQKEVNRRMALAKK